MSHFVTFTKVAGTWNYPLRHRGQFYMMRQRVLGGEAVAMEKLRQIGFGLSAKLVVAVAVLSWTAFAGIAGEASEYAAALQKIFLSLDAEGVDIPFGGAIAAPLGIPQQTVTVHELPPVRTSTLDVVHVFERFKDGSGYVVLKFTESGFVAVRFDKNFDFVAAAVQRYGQPVAVLSGAAAQEVLTQELHDYQTIASRLTAHP